MCFAVILATPLALVDTDLACARRRLSRGGWIID